MKNIHIIPTDKPSRLYLGDNGNLVLGLMKNSIENKNNDFTNQNIYITSDEEIKEGDWYIIEFNSTKITKCTSEQELISIEGRNDCKKIILTTDQDLIKDGVQSIDAEFLEGFCSKNGKVGYIESKQGRTCTNNCSVVCGECQIFDKKPITNLEKLLFPELVTELVGYYKNTQLVEKPKEVVEKTTKMYSEEEVLELLNKREKYTSQSPETDWFSISKWFEQFKKK